MSLGDRQGSEGILQGLVMLHHPFRNNAHLSCRSLTTVKQVREAADAFKHYSSFHEAALSARNLPGDDVLDIAAPNQAEAAAWASGDYAAR